MPVASASSTLPAVPLMAAVQVASGVGRGSVPAVPLASCTRKWLPATIEPVRVQLLPRLPAAE